MQAEKLKAMTQRACCQREVLMRKRQRERGGNRERSRERGGERERGSWRVKRQRSGKLPSVYC